MARQHRSPVQAHDGFALVELLVVIVIVGILAAIALPSLLEQRSKSQDAEAKVYLVAAQKALEIWHTEHGSYADADVTGLKRIEPAVGRMRNPALSVTESTFEVSIDSASPSGGRRFTLAKDAGDEIVRSCANGGHGACPAGGRW
jgi:type IV pilus assembly protein PilA